MKIIGVQSDRFKAWHSNSGESKNNGAYWYAKEIEKNILPKLKDLDTTIVTAGATLLKKQPAMYSVVVCHDNRSTISSYRHLLKLGNTFICSKHSTADTLTKAGEKAVYVPLSIDTRYVAKYKTDKTEDIAYVGNPWAFKQSYLKSLPDNVVQLSGMERLDLIKAMAKFKRVIAEGRCMMEAQVLGCETEVPVYPDGHESVYVEALDNRDTIDLWRTAIEAHIEAVGSKCIIRVMRRFNDLEAGRTRYRGEMFLADKSRADVLLANKIKIVEVV